ncbi:hypothetical protein [Saccharothrix sp. Mg75]|uniref:hypothetical protein n=1 Tax=Saccharothrix sp. Mg75 TaxID=3445357 RepID=UPI003EE826DF
MESAVQFMTASSASPRPPVPPSAERGRPSCHWCGLRTDWGWPAGHPAAPAMTGDVLAHRFCADPANRRFDADAPGDPVVVRRARLAFALRGAGPRGWRWFELGSDEQRTTVAHLRSMLRLGAPVTAADVVTAATGPLTRRLYRERVRRWARLPLPSAPARGAL